MRFGSVCSGIEAASEAWKPLGWEPAFYAEIDPFACAVLKHHHPDVPNYGDFTQMLDPNHEVRRGPPIDLLVGGTPCQDFSVAGLRAGIEGARGSLSVAFLQLAQVLRPRWLVWENVPGVLSSDDGRALGAFLGGLEELGFGWAYRVLDAQYVRVDGYPRAVPQRRRRIFVVGHSRGDWLRPGSVLLEPEGSDRHLVPRRTTREETAPAAGCCASGRCRCGADRPPSHEDADGGERGGLTPTQVGSHWDGPAFAHPTLNQSASVAGGVGASNQEVFSQRGAYLVPAFSPTLPPAAPPALHFDVYNHRTTGNVCGIVREQHGTNMKAVLQPMCYPADRTGMAVRRLTPVECERLQGFPDEHTRIPWRRKPASDCPDGPRYKALGNSMAVNCMRWIGQRIVLVEEVFSELEADAPEEP